MTYERPVEINVSPRKLIAVQISSTDHVTTTIILNLFRIKPCEGKHRGSCVLSCSKIRCLHYLIIEIAWTRAIPSNSTHKVINKKSSQTFQLHHSLIPNLCTFYKQSIMPRTLNPAKFVLESQGNQREQKTSKTRKEFDTMPLNLNLRQLY